MLSNTDEYCAATPVKVFGNCGDAKTNTGALIRFEFCGHDYTYLILDKARDNETPCLFKSTIYKFGNEILYEYVRQLSCLELFKLVSPL